jgi:hypothetical protein
MSDPYVREVGTVTDLDGLAVRIGVDYDTVTIAIPVREVRLTQAQVEEFSQVFVSACWEAAQYHGTQAGARS